MITGESRPVPRGCGRPGRRRHRGHRHRAAGARSPRSGTTPRWPASSGWSPRRRPPPRRAQRLADRAAGWLFWFALGAAVITAAVWVAARDAGEAWCVRSPCWSSPAPTPSAWRSRWWSPSPPSAPPRGGVLVKDRLALERMRTVDTVLFDKTGTLTKGQPGCHRRHDRPAPTREDELLGLAAAAEADSEHPLARAIVARGRAPRPRACRRPTDFAVLDRGRGAAPPSTGRTVSVGGPPCSPSAGSGRLPAAGSGRDAAARSSCTSSSTAQVAGALAPGRRGPAGVPRGGRRAPRARRAGRDDHRRRRAGGPRRRPPSSASTRSSPESGPRTRARRSPSCRPRAAASPWSATASTTPPPWPRPTSASPSAPAPTSPSPPPGSSSPATTPARCSR